MRDLTDTLKNTQQAMTIDPLAKVHLTDGVDIYTYTRDRILDINNPEEPYSQTAKVLLDNSENDLNDIDLKGFYGFISMGAITSAGEEYSDGPLLWVIAQRFDSSPGKLTCELSLIGIPNWLALDKASRNYIPDEDDEKTIKTLLTEILGASLGCFSHCKAYTVVFDDEGKPFFATSLINTYKPKDSLRIYKGNSRLAIAKRLLECTECVMLVKADGKPHIFVPQIKGTPVYTYSLEAGHTFFSKAYRQALVIPNYIYASSPPPTVPNFVIVTSAPYSGEAKDQTDIDKFGARKHTADYGAGTFASNAECAAQALLDLNGYIALHDPYYEGIATDPVSIAALKTDTFSGEIRAYWQASFKDDDQAKAVAEAMLAKVKLNSEIGGADVPLNVGQEVYDYINAVDARQGDERAGTIGSLTKHYNAEEAEWRMTFSLGQRPKAVDVMAAIEEDAPYFGRLIVDNLYAKNILAESLDMYWIDPDGTIDLSKIGDNLDNLPDGELYARVKTLHLDAEGGIKMDEHIIFDEGYNPITKESAIHRGTTPPEDLTKLWIDTTTELNVVKRYNGVTAQWERASPANLDQLENGTDYARVKKMALNTDGLILIDQIYTVGGTFGLVKSMGLTADGLILMDELVDGTYGRVRSAGLSATGLVLLDQVVEGTYGRVKSAYISAGRILLDSVETGTYGLVKTTDISAGHIKLDTVIEGTYGRVKSADISAGHILLQTTIDGGGYKKYTASEALKLLGIEKGAETTTGKSLSVLTDRTLGFIADTTTRKTVNASEKTGASLAYDTLYSKLTAYGLKLWTANSSTRVELTANGLKGYSAGALQVEIKASDGKIYAGAGKVVIDATGIKIQDESVVFYYGATKRGFLKGTSSGLSLVSWSSTLWLEAAAGYGMNFRARYYIFSDPTGDANAEGVQMQGMQYLNLPRRSSHPTGYGGKLYYNTTDSHPYVYATGDWRSID